MIFLLANTLACVTLAILVNIDDKRKVETFCFYSSTWLWFLGDIVTEEVMSEFTTYQFTVLFMKPEILKGNTS